MAIALLFPQGVYAQDAVADPDPQQLPQPLPLPLPQPLPQPPPDKPRSVRALELHDEARHLYTKGKYDEAVVKLREAVELDPEAKILFYNLGLIEEKRGDLPAAISNYRRCLELETGEDERVKIAHIIKRLEGAKHYTAFEEADAGRSKPAPAQQPAAGDDGGISSWVWVSGGVALVSFGVAAVLASQASARDPGDEAITGDDVTVQSLRDDASAAHSLAIGADVFLAVGVAATAATVVLAITTSGSDDSVSVALGPAHGRVTWRF
jgi:tetratricopeptide (TPR) repeat protein